MDHRGLDVDEVCHVLRARFQRVLLLTEPLVHDQTVFSDAPVGWALRRVPDGRCLPVLRVLRASSSHSSLAVLWKWHQERAIVRGHAGALNRVMRLSVHHYRRLFVV